jgi:hypothetical protein
MEEIPEESLLDVMNFLENKEEFSSELKQLEH